MTCQQCDAIDFLSILPQQPLVQRRNIVQHTQHRWHKTMSSLRASADTGCSFCSSALRELSQSLPGTALLELEEEDVYLTMLPWPDHSNVGFSTVQGNTELIAYCGPKDFTTEILDDPLELRRIAIARFHVCVERNERERETGTMDKQVFPFGVISGRTICQDAASQQCFDIARSWFNRCLSGSKSGCGKHVWCHHVSWDKKSAITPQSPTKVFIPSRTINVGTIDSGKAPFLQIHSQNDDSGPKSVPISWATLSHCWGGSALMVTSTHTLEEHTREIPMDRMPQTFLDAVNITRELGIEHLWIDSLCIVQDSEEDWVNESSKMAQVYRYSILNIAAEASRNAGDGIFKPRTFRRLLAKFPLRWRGELLVFPLLRNWMESLCGDASILSKRGWVLQENLLSPRTLHFGLEQIFWSCASTIISEGDMAPLPKEVIGRLSADWNWHLSKRFLTLQGNLSEIEPRSPYALEIWYNRWYEVVTNYSARHLTRQSDVFPALAGLAQAFILRLQDDYIAGLFAGNLHHGILWHTDLFDEVKRAIPYRAPTWS
ncbi:uncharacterized protein PAC_06069 [Phialocephala subalpina]|uniref:Heterokaryon incompatibility domain-containing protein n=1 Tax=Phialocephala subalpina TaxID=576137 RepID=A0A1L7WTS9_9HELO|nr:uncharacterized protein PAC_06069 [Phialocephala subalpina]